MINIQVDMGDLVYTPLVCLQIILLQIQSHCLNQMLSQTELRPGPTIF